FDAALNDFIGNGESEVEDVENSADAEDVEVAEPVGTSNIFGALDNLTGLRDVKAKLVAYERVVRFNKMRADRGLPTSATPLHAMFLGSPGTGKTTVAKLLGHMLRRAGLLSKGHVVVRERATLLGQNYNSESEKTMAAIEEAQGGILLIDEAYQLYQSNDARDPGKFVIDTLLTALADESNRDWMLVLAGYPDEMMNLFNINPGFKSRIPDSNIYRFEDFTASELMEIADNYLKRLRYTLSDEARKALSGRLDADYACRTKNFGNARHVINMIQTEVLPAMALRLTYCG
ncbi:MAG: AAA family ATPase, partial [Muribaculaceae bacterium]|nr:AAA family ATPase [Muribaculaceae bacterium]